MTRRPRRYTDTSSPHRQCRRVIDGKISGRIVVPGDEPESRDYSARRSSDHAGILKGGLSPPSLLNAKSTWKIESELSIERLRQRLRDTSQEQDRVIS